MLCTGSSYVNVSEVPPDDEFDLDEPTHTDPLATAPMRALIFAAPSDDAAVTL